MAAARCRDVRSSNGGVRGAPLSSLQWWHGAGTPYPVAVASGEVVAAVVGPRKVGGLTGGLFVFYFLK
jgi:hypothetical protein